MPTIAAPRSHWLAALRRQDRTKFSALGGDGQDVSFEQAFSNLAHAYLSDKAPSLLDHEQGFQLLDRNQENTKAVGVFGFKVGSNQLYAPVFFLQGDLKGHELLYLKNQDLFVPLKENWLNYILNRKPHILGESTPRQTSNLGVMSPDLSRVRGTSKYAESLPAWCRPFAYKYASLIADGSLEDTLGELKAHCAERLDLGHFVKMAGLDMLTVLVDHLRAHPVVAEAFDRYHGVDLLHGAVKEAAARQKVGSVLVPSRRRPVIHTDSVLGEKQAKKKTDGDANQKLKVLTYDTTLVEGLPEGTTEEDQEKLLKEKFVIQDGRSDDEVSVPYNVQTEKQLFNPMESGLYWVLTKPGDFEKCLVIINPHGPHGRKGFATVVHADGEKNWINIYATEVWATSKIEGKDYDTWYNGLSDVKSLSKSEDRVVLVGPRGNGTCPFKVTKSVGEDEQDTKDYEVEFSTYAEGRRNSHRFGFRDYESDIRDYDDYAEWRDGQRVHIDAKEGTDLRSTRGDLYVPKGYKVIRAEKSKEDADSDKHDGPCGCLGSSGSMSSTPALRLGNLVDAELALKTKTAMLKIAHTGTEVFVNDGASLSPLGGLIHLVREHGFREDVARHMLKKAELFRAAKYRVKYAFGSSLSGGPSAPGIPDPQYGAYNPMGADVQTQGMQEEEIPVQGMDAGSYDQSGYDVRPQSTMPGDANGGGGMGQDAQATQQAAQSGQKELFDTAMIGSMLKAVRDDTMIDQYLPDLIKGMDRKGRLLFQFYAHGDKFAERYGKSDMPELEDALRNAFEMDGDVVIFLKQKTVEPYPEQADAVSMGLGKQQL